MKKTQTTKTKTNKNELKNKGVNMKKMQTEKTIKSCNVEVPYSLDWHYTLLNIKAELNDFVANDREWDDTSYGILPDSADLETMKNGNHYYFECTIYAEFNDGEIKKICYTPYKKMIHHKLHNMDDSEIIDMVNEDCDRLFYDIGIEGFNWVGYYQFMEVNGWNIDSLNSYLTNIVGGYDYIDCLIDFCDCSIPELYEIVSKKYSEKR